MEILIKIKNGRRVLFVCFISLILICLLVSVINKKNNNIDFVDDFIGEYFYSEIYSPEIKLVYNLNIYRDGEGTPRAILQTDGFQSQTKISAIVKSTDDDKIALIYEENLIENIDDEYTKGDVLLELCLQKKQLTTNWISLKPHKTNADKEVFFEKRK